jgi:nicotinate-nucleotide pyrophosphorylase
LLRYSRRIDIIKDNRISVCGSISVGRITQSAPAVDIGLEAVVRA